MSKKNKRNPLPAINRAIYRKENFVLPIMGSKWSVKFVDKETPALEDGMSITICDKNQILIDNDLNHQQTQTTAYHELVHACIDEAGLTEVLDKKLGKELHEGLVENLAKVLKSFLSINNEKVRMNLKILKMIEQQQRRTR